jgi:DNA polymerase-1
MIDAELALQMVRTSKVLAYDTETTGLDVHAVVCGYVFNDGDNNVYVPVRHDRGGNIPDAKGFEFALNDAFNYRNRFALLTVGHHLAFDLRMSRRHGVYIRGPLECTMINESLINDENDGLSLDDCCRRHSVTAKKGAELYAHLSHNFGGLPDRKQMGNFWRLSGDDPIAVDYATGDGVSTLALWRAQQAHLDNIPEDGSGRSLRQVHKLECDLIPYVDRMNAIGIKIAPEEKIAPIMNALDTDIKAAMALFPPGFNVRSPGDVETAYRKLGVTDFDTTAGGRPSFTEKWLSTNELGRAILNVRRLEKARDSFITPILKTHNQNGRVHPILNQYKTTEQTGTDQGRFSCTDPNLQAFPKRNKEVGSLVRQLFVPDAGDIYDVDFSQQEPRLFAHYSEESKLIEGYNANPPVDVHDIAMQITSLDRDTAKRMGMGILTGMGYTSLAGHLGWSIDEATRGHRQYLDGMPRIREFQVLAKKVMERRGFVRTILGRIAYISDKRAMYKAVSRIIQGSGADHTKTMLLRACQFAEAEGNIDIMLTIHDSFIWQCEPSANIKELVRIIEDVQSPPFNLAVPIPVEVTRGANWAEASYGKKIKSVGEGWII